MTLDPMAANEASRARLAALLARLDERALTRVVHGRWTVAATLAHLAFWDRLATALIARWRRGEDHDFGAADWHDDVLNDALLEDWLAIDPLSAVALVEAATAANVRALAILDPAGRARLAGDGAASWLLLRHRHRDEHLDDIERALG